MRLVVCAVGSLMFATAALGQGLATGDWPGEIRIDGAKQSATFEIRKKEGASDYKVKAIINDRTFRVEKFRVDKKTKALKFLISFGDTYDCNIAPANDDAGAYFGACRHVDPDKEMRIEVTMTKPPGDESAQPSTASADSADGSDAPKKDKKKQD